MPLSKGCLGWFSVPKGQEDSAQGFNPISANLIKTSAGRMSFVPEGQHDSSQARSAWSHEENSPVPAGRLNGSSVSPVVSPEWREDKAQLG